jgi:hypothetical protein
MNFIRMTNRLINLDHITDIVLHDDGTATLWYDCEVGEGSSYIANKTETRNLLSVVTPKWD